MQLKPPSPGVASILVTSFPLLRLWIVIILALSLIFASSIGTTIWPGSLPPLTRSKYAMPDEDVRESSGR